MIEVLYTNLASMPAVGPMFTREDHRLKELSLPRGQQRIPRRSQTYEDYKLPESPVTAIFNIFEQLRFVEESPRGSATSTVEQAEPQTKAVPRRRPPLGPPRRSYSATDKEPVPKPSTGLILLDLPAELHYTIFDFLDPIDSTCLGLTNKHFYSIHRRMRGRVPLSTRREGPNELEWAWHLAGAVVRPPGSEKDMNALTKLRVRGQGYCRKCGVIRCELQKHIQTWMGDGAEYCSIKQKFGQAAPAGAKPYCYMSKPGDPERCGRHWIRKSKVVLQ